MSFLIKALQTPCWLCKRAIFVFECGKVITRILNFTLHHQSVQCGLIQLSADHHNKRFQRSCSFTSKVVQLLNAQAYIPVKPVTCVGYFLISTDVFQLANIIYRKHEWTLLKRFSLESLRSGVALEWCCTKWNSFAVRQVFLVQTCKINNNHTAGLWSMCKTRSFGNR